VGVGEGGVEGVCRAGSCGGVAAGGVEGEQQFAEAGVVAVEAGLALGGGDREGEERGEGADDRGAAIGVVAALEELGEAVGLRAGEAAGVVLEGGEDAGEGTVVTGELVSRRAAASRSAGRRTRRPARKSVQAAM
jgi:hypothetical protein